MESPLELIRYDAASQTFSLGEEALAVLRSIEGPVGVVTVCGRAREGKSFVLNQLLGRNNGFHVASTHRPCTKGLWMWSHPVKRTAPDGRDYHLVLLDTEGIDAFDQTGQYSTQICSLAVLLSSFFIYNQMGGIDESSLDRLSLVTEVTKRVRVRAEGSNDDLKEFTPSFMWLLRDFYLDLVEDDREITAGDYLEVVLRPLVGSGPMIEAKNQIRESIKSLFPDRDCATLVRPVNDERDLKKLCTLPPENLREEFTKGINQFTERVFMKAQPKKIGSQVLTGSMLTALAEGYVNAINEGAVPTIATAWQVVAETECRYAAERAEATYISEFNMEIDPEENEMKAENQRSLDSARRVFAKFAVGDEETRKVHEEKLLENLSRRFSLLASLKLAEASKEVEELLAKLSGDLRKGLRQGLEKPAELHSQVEEFMEVYRIMAFGPTKWERLATIFLDNYAGGLVDELSKSNKTISSLTHDLESEKKRRDVDLGRERVLRKEFEDLKRELERLRPCEDEVLQLRTLLAGANQMAKGSGGRPGQMFVHRDLGKAMMRQELEETATRYESAEPRVMWGAIGTPSPREESGVAKTKESSDMLVDDEVSSGVSSGISSLRSKKSRQWREARPVANEESVNESPSDSRVHRSQSGRHMRSSSGGVRRETLNRAFSVDNTLEKSSRGLSTGTFSRRGKSRDEITEGEESGYSRTVTSGHSTQPSTRTGSPEQSFSSSMRKASSSKGGSMRSSESPPAQGGNENVNFENCAKLGVEPESMTIAEIKEWLTLQGHGGTVWDLAIQGKMKKADWVSLIKRVAGG
ncbi:hypothetical protein BSKO_00080 [Bryopsis sp. KO-2023]|nr:hypothetical protein BSKO_00080 [Bryopsis sp. KO-2023]